MPPLSSNLSENNAISVWNMDILNPTTRLIDLMCLGRPRVIATGLLDTSDGALLVDPGPGSCLDALRSALRHAGIAGRDLHGVLLTHIHLDHAGASGALVREFPHVVVYVHERGAPHLTDPARLISSATRIYGGEMDRLWGEFAPVPASHLRTLVGGEVLRIGGRELDVAYTPGHASHHVCYYDHETGIAFVGDTAGVRTGEIPYVLPPTPPPDIDIPAWRSTMATIRAWSPSGLFLTHFGLKSDVNAHLDVLAEELAEWERISGDVVNTVAEHEREGHFIQRVAARIVDRLGAEDADTYRAAVSLEHCWMGLARYWTKRRGV
jgi:glyoxylase-like metal-dependent hydrolase (beta-lactamase superfamily II)